MQNELIKKKFPAYFPIHNLPKGAKGEKIKVYRVCKWGKIERRAFYSNYEEYKKLGIKLKEFDDDDILYHSVSTYERRRDIRNRLKCLSRHEPRCIVAQGFTEPECGLSQRSRDRAETKNSHVDWWIFENAEPHKCHFEEVDII